MRYIQGFREGGAAHHLAHELQVLGRQLDEQGRDIRLMEVCGSHTMAIARYGIRALLPKRLTLLSGPGCPVCVTDAGYIDAAIELTMQGATVATFGDMVRVPGTQGTLAEARSRGGSVEVCWSPDQAIKLAEANPARQIVFLAIGFETTIAPVVSLVKAAQVRGLDNLTLLTAFKLVPPALGALLADPEVKVDGFLCPAHVSAIIGSEAYRPFVERDGVPCVVAGFEPLDILYGLLELTRQLATDSPALVNQYDRVVRPQGNRRAQALIDELLEPVDATWRGIGKIPQSGLALRPSFAPWDAQKRFHLQVEQEERATRCRCGDVLKGKIRPAECPLFGRACLPSRPIGPCMVSAEGSCAAEYKYAATSRSAGGSGPSPVVPS